MRSSCCARDSHWAFGFGTGRLTDEASDAPLPELALARRKHAVPADAFVTVPIGGRLEIDAGP